MDNWKGNKSCLVSSFDVLTEHKVNGLASISMCQLNKIFMQIIENTQQMNGVSHTKSNHIRPIFHSQDFQTANAQ